jgi:hypothetical protein
VVTDVLRPDLRDRDHMLPTRTDHPTARELAHRVADGIHVTLWWHPAAASVSLAVDDRRTGERFELPVPGERALFAFRHPFAFAG